jgi:hypothetical protein
MTRPSFEWAGAAAAAAATAAVVEDVPGWDGRREEGGPSLTFSLYVALSFSLAVTPSLPSRSWSLSRALVLYLL